MSDETRRFIRQAGGTGGGAALSRALGMLRDSLLASLLGVGDVMDAFVTALRLPDLSRRLFQEGALTAEFVPEVARRADRTEGVSGFVAATLRLWLVLSILFLIVTEGGALALFSWESLGTRDELTRRLFAILVPFVPLIAGSAIFAGALQALGRFRVPALASAMLNAVWLAALAYCYAAGDIGDIAAATILAAAVACGGAVQLVALGLATRSAGVRLRTPTAEEARLARRLVARAPVVAAAILVVPLCMALDGWWAWAASRSEGFPAYAWFPPAEVWSRRLAEGAASAAYCSERLCMLPVGIATSAIGAVILPSLAHAASRTRNDDLRRQWSRALRWATYLAIPASAGIWFVGAPLSRLLFQHGEAGDEGAARIAAWVGAYSLLVVPAAWSGIFVRGVAATEGLRFAAAWGVACVAASFVLDGIVALARWELGLAWSTALVATLHAAGLATFVAFRRGGLDRRWLVTIVQSAAAAGGMLAVLGAVHSTLPTSSESSGASQALNDAAYAALCTATGAVVYFALSRLLQMTEWEELRAMRRKRED